MQGVKVIFDNSKYNYVTSCNGTLEQIRHYFVGKYFDVGIYPIELMRKCTDIELV